MVAMGLLCYQSDAIFASKFHGFWTSRISMIFRQVTRNDLCQHSYSPERHEFILQTWHVGCIPSLKTQRIIQDFQA